MTSQIDPAPSDINADYELPPGFYVLIKPCIDGTGEPFNTRAGLIRLYQAALNYRRRYPVYQESIAEWTVSAGASSPLVNDNDIFEAIHAELGSLEARSATDTDDDIENGWQRIALWVEDLSR